MKRFYLFLMIAAWAGFAQAQTFNITFQVDMSEYPLTFTEANVNGTWNAWCGSCNPLADPDGDSIWTAVIPIPAGVHEFKYTVDGWTDQENFAGGEPCTVTNGGFTNRALNVTSDSTVSINCFNSCDSCGAAPPPAPGNMTFSVDMNQYGGAFTLVELNGSFNGWCGTCNPMDDSDGDGIWSVTLPLPGGEHEYKFTVDNFNDQENFPGGEVCTKTTGAFTNRVVTVDGDSTVPTVCWNSCDSCGLIMDTVNVSFRVDMNNESVCNPPDSVTVAGSFNGWPAPGTKMEDNDGDGVYELTMEMVTNTFYEFKFQNNVGGNVLWESSSNRSFTVHNSNDTTLGMVCFNEMGMCGPPPPPAADVTFRVDMTQAVPADTIWVIGSFTDPQWQDGAIPLTPGSEVGVFEATANICDQTFQYKFVNGNVNVTANEEFDGDTAVACAVPNGIGGFNREFTRTSGDAVILETYVFGTCDISTVGIEEANRQIPLTVYPNPFSEQTVIEFSEGNQHRNIVLTDLAGKVIRQWAAYTSNRLEITREHLRSGIYFVTVSDQAGRTSNLKLVVN